MRILAVDTSGPVAGVAILNDNRIVYEACAVTPHTHSVNEMPMVEEALIKTGLSLGDMDGIGVVTGPGSFTGVRLGVSMAKGMAHGSGLPCVAIDGLEALASGFSGFTGIICPIMDARAGQVYCAAFRPGLPPLRLMEDAAMKLTDYVALLQNASEKEKGGALLFVGDGVAAYQAEIAERLHERAVFASPANCYLRAANVALLAQAYFDKRVEYTELMPMYLRAPQAERQRAAKEAAERNEKDSHEQ